MKFACKRCKRPLQAKLLSVRRLIICPTCGLKMRLPNCLPPALSRLYQRSAN
jgi:hypothetical protein